MKGNFIVAGLTWVAMVSTLTLGFGQQAARADADSPTARTFRMGFTAFPPDDTPQGAEIVNQFIHANADIVAQHMESVPWAEALSGAPFQEHLTNDWANRKKNLPPNATNYVALNPGRNNLADYWGKTEHDPLPEEFKGKTFNDPIVKKAYLNYCKRAIDFFKPEFLAIGIEFNEITLNAPEKGPEYAELHKYIYTELKKSYPELPIFASFTLHGLLDERRSKEGRERSLAAVKELMPYNDLIGMSFYPFFGNLSNNVDESFLFLTSNFDSYKKPYAFAETGEAADRLALKDGGKVWQIEGSPQRQADYYRKLFAFAQKRSIPFIISFLCKDYDDLWKKIAPITPALFQAWQDNGFLDETGKQRAAYSVWKKEFDLPLRPLSQEKKAG
jgi:hypothetical protein